MASDAPNMKVNLGANTTDFTRGMKQARAEVKDFASLTNSALGSLGSALGVDTGKVEQLASAFRGLGRKLGEAGTEGSKALGTLASGVSTLGVGIAALGIAGAVAGFKALNAEAENFKSTVAGANIELQTQAYIDTYKQFMHDINAETGKGVAEAQAEVKKNWAATWASMAQSLGAMQMGPSAGGAPLAPGSNIGMEQWAEQVSAANAKAERAAAIAKELYELTRKQSDQTRIIADLDARIAENRMIMRDETYSLAERQAAYDAILADITQKESLLLPIEQRRTALMDEMVSLTNSTPAQVDAANQQYVRQQSIVRQINDEKASLLRYANSLNRQERATTEELKKQKELEEQIAASRAELKSFLGLGTPAALTSGITPTGSIIPQTIDTTALQGQINAALGGSLYLQVGLQIDKWQLVDFSRQLETTIAGLALSLSDSIGGLIGDLVTGGDAWGNFANAAMSAFGDMATAIGRIAIETGIAALGIKAAIESLGPAGAAIAIGAGAALVALGAAVKAGMSNVAAGNYSSTASVASSNYSTMGADDFVTRDLTVNVTGTLQADGSQLKAVLKNTDRNDYYTG